MANFELIDARPELVQAMRDLAQAGADIPQLVDVIRSRLGLTQGEAILPVLFYFRAAYYLRLREALPLREWLTGRDRSEVDERPVPAMARNKWKWQKRESVPA
jgi:hypothetical protein